MSDTLKPTTTITPDTHAAANGQWDCVHWSTPTPASESSRTSVLFFQNGPIKEHGVNGVQIDDVLKVCLARLKMLNKAYPCRENSLTITKLQEALLWQGERTARRTSQGVEGFDRPAPVE